MLVRSLKVATGDPPVLGDALGAAEGALGVTEGTTEGTELGPAEGLRLSGLTLPVGEAEGSCPRESEALKNPIAMANKMRFVM